MKTELSLILPSWLPALEILAVPRRPSPVVVDLSNRHTHTTTVRELIATFPAPPRRLPDIPVTPWHRRVISGTLSAVFPLNDELAEMFGIPGPNELDRWENEGGR